MKTVEDYLREVDYRALNTYVPSTFALKFGLFIKYCNGNNTDMNVTPAFHYKMLDNLCKPNSVRLLNLVFRGASKAISLDTYVLTVNGIKQMKDIHIGDKLFDRNGDVTSVIAESKIFTNQCYKVKLADGTSFIANEDHIHIVEKITTNHKWKEYELTTSEILKKGVTYNRTVSDRNPSGKESKWFIPLISKPLQYPTQNLLIDPYTLGVIIGDGNISAENYIATLTAHKEDMAEMLSNIKYSAGKLHTDKRNNNVISCRLLKSGKDIKQVLGYCTARDKYIPKQYLIGDYSQRLELLRGLMDTDGTISDRGHYYFATTSKILAINVRYLVKSLGGYARIAIHKNDFGEYYDVHMHLWNDNPFKLKRKANKWKPNIHYKRGKRVAIKSITPIPEVVKSKCIAVDSPTKSYVLGGNIVTHNTTLFGQYLLLYLAVFRNLPNFGFIDSALFVGDTMDRGVKNLRQNLEYRYEYSDYLKELLPEAKFTDAYIEFKNKHGLPFAIKLFGATTGVRGTQIFNKRPSFLLMDDILTDTAAASMTELENIKTTIYSSLFPALDPRHRKIVFNGTPFNKADPLWEAVNSGTWDVNVYPICQEFPCAKEDFVGAWEDRFTFDFVNDEYKNAVANNRLIAFKREYMLQIISEDTRLILDEDIKFVSIKDILKDKHNYEFIITTDFATGASKTSDYTVISVWALDMDKNIILVDGLCAKQLMSKTIDDLFRYVAKWNPQSVGIEVSGQQGAFVSLLDDRMIETGQYFNIASGKNSGKKRGISPGNMNKMQRFNLVLPLFKARKIHFAEELKGTAYMDELLDELKSADMTGFKSVHDDIIDTISMLELMYYYFPSEPEKALEVPKNLPVGVSEDMWTQSMLEMENKSSLEDYVV